MSLILSLVFSNNFVACFIVQNIKTEFLHFVILDLGWLEKFWLNNFWDIIIWYDYILYMIHIPKFGAHLTQVFTKLTTQFHRWLSRWNLFHNHACSKSSLHCKYRSLDGFKCILLVKDLSISSPDPLAYKYWILSWMILGTRTRKRAELSPLRTTWILFIFKLL